jgi:hypothetical protein
MAVSSNSSFSRFFCCSPGESSSFIFTPLVLSLPNPAILPAFLGALLSCTIGVGLEILGFGSAATGVGAC